MPRSDDQLTADFAEILVSPEFRQASSAAFAANPEHHRQQQISAEQIICDGLCAYRTADDGRAWETRRQATIAELSGADLGPFSEYIHAQGGESQPSDLTTEDLAAADPEIVRTNTRILNLNTTYDHPVIFLEAALAMMRQRKGISATHSNVGPGNYSTTIKFFTDKYLHPDSERLDTETIKDLVNPCMEGFVRTASRVKTNFVEMTNIYYSIAHLPQGAFDQRHTRAILTYSLEQLPTYHQGTLSTLISALGKLNLMETNGVAADLIDLALRKNASFETTRDMHQALRAIANVPPSPAANRAFATFLETRNNLEEPLDILGIDALNERLLYIAGNVISDPALIRVACGIADSTTRKAVQLFRQQQYSPETTKNQLDQLEIIIRRIIDNCEQMQALAKV